MSHTFDWTVRDSTVLLQDAWITLRADTCLMPNGQVLAPYYVLDYPAWTNVVALTRQQEVVLVRQYRHGLRKTVLELPCGCVEAQDDSPLTTIKRELLEETGYASEDMIETGKISPNSANHSNFTHCFLATAAQQMQLPMQEKTEQLETVLVPLQGVMELIQRGEFYQALHIASFFLALQKLGKLNVKY